MVEQSTSSIHGRAARSWKRHGWHALLLTILAGEFLAAVLLHRPDEDLQAILDDGAGRAQVAALAVLTNRGDPIDVDAAAVQRLLNSDNMLIREWTMTANFARLAPPKMLLRHARSFGNPAERYRRQFLFKYAIGRRNSMKLSELARFLDAEEVNP